MQKKKSKTQDAETEAAAVDPVNDVKQLAKSLKAKGKGK